MTGARPLASSPDNPAEASGSAGRRLVSVDLLRGAVMVLMAIDHVRVFSGHPAGGSTPGIFFTRWVTHFCAPVFIFLAGTSAFLYGRRHAGLSRFLATRGAWLVVLELSALRLAWTFNTDLANYNMAGVIWVIGWCMIILAVLVRLPLRVVGVFGLAVMLGHNLLDGFAGGLVGSVGDGPVAALWKVFYLGFFAGPIGLGDHGPSLIVLYSIVPWVGVIAAGYGFGEVMTLEPGRRDRICRVVGLSSIAAFVILRSSGVYGDPNPWNPSSSGTASMPPWLAFLNTTKYPASLEFLLMTLGPAIALIPMLERARGPLARWTTVFGKVPFFFYVLHIPLIHALSLAVSFLREGSINAWLFANHPMGNPPPPDGYTWSLPLLYLVWGIAILVLYPACVWFGNLKVRRKDWWLSYL